MRTLFKDELSNEAVVGLDSVVCFDKLYMIQMIVDINNSKLEAIIDEACSKLKKELLSLPLKYSKNEKQKIKN